MTRSLFLFSGLIFFGITFAFFYYVSTVNRHGRDFARLTIGMQQSQIVKLMGKPSHQELQHQTYGLFASHPCEGACHSRLWWETPFFTGLEAWSVEIDEHGGALHKAHWASP